jgi:uncharacterized pyridoxal phosphate-containing UPF0001 family protein
MQRHGQPDTHTRYWIDIPNLWAIETVDTQKRAQLLERACQQIGRTEPLRVFVQVNTSGEESKSN